MAGREDSDLLMEEADDLPPLVDSHGDAIPSVSNGPAADTQAVDPHKFVEVISKRKRKRRTDETMDAATELPEVDGSNAASKKSSATNRTNRRINDRAEIRSIPVPQHRLTPLKQSWVQLVKPIVEHMKLQIRFNTRMRRIELRNSPETSDVSNLQKAADFCKAFVLGFDVNDAMALLRLDDIFIESFEIEDVKPLKGEHLSRAIGRLAGKDGRTKFTIENATKTRIVLADAKIHVLGSYTNCRAARHAICSLIMGAQPSKVYGNLRSLASRASERF